MLRLFPFHFIFVQVVSFRCLVVCNECVCTRPNNLALSIRSAALLRGFLFFFVCVLRVVSAVFLHARSFHITFSFIFLQEFRSDKRERLSRARKDVEREENAEPFHYLALSFFAAAQSVTPDRRPSAVTGKERKPNKWFLLRLLSLPLFIM